MSTNNIQSKKSTQPEKARLGAVGENMVVSMLMQHGWDAFNANCTIKNYKSIDIVCLNSEIKETTIYPWKPASALIQVKTSVQKNIPTGFTIEDSLLTSSSCHPKIFIKEFGDFLMPCHQHGLGVNLLVQR